MDKPVLVIGDLHLKLSNLAIAEKFFKYVRWLVENRGVRTIIFLGDAYDAKAIIHADVQTFFLNEIGQLSGCKIYIIVGNHDFASTNLGNHSLKPFELFENVTVVDKILVEEKCVMIAYGKSADTETALQRPDVVGKVIFGHFAVNGFSYGNGKDVDDGIDPKFLRGPAILGHLHAPKDSGKICYLGSPWSHSFGEANQNKRLLILTDKGNEMVEVEGLPRHVTFAWDGDDTSKSASQNDFCKVVGVPLACREEAKKIFEGHNVVFEFLPEVNNDVRIDAKKSYDEMLKEYIDKNLAGSKVTQLDPEKLYRLGKKYLEVK